MTLIKLVSRCYSSVATSSVASHTWKSFASIPGPKCYPVVGSVPNYLPGIGKYDPNNVVKSGIQKFHDFGPIIKERFFAHEAIFLYDPVDIETLFRNAKNTRRSHLTLGHIRADSEDHVNGGILYENGDAWYQLRAGSQQSLTMEAFKQYIPHIDRYTSRLLQKIEDDSIMNKVIEKDFLLALLAHNCDIMGHMLFGLEWDCVKDILDEEALNTRVIHSSTYFNRMMAPMDNGLMLWKLFPTPLYRKLKKCSEDVDMIPKDEVRKRLQDRQLANGPGILNSWIREGSLDGRTMTTILSDLLLAGIDTTSYSLAFTLYNLSAHKSAQDKLYQEITSLLPPGQLSGSSDDGEELAKAISKAKYLKHVVKESLRLFPVSVGTSRVLENPCVIRGYQIPANVTVITMNQISCRLEDYVERANEFIPERFEGDSGFRKIRPFTILPFGHGPRACIGRRVAEMSIYIFLFRLISQYEITWIAGKPLDCIAHSITEPDGPLLFQFSKRKQK